MFIKKLVLITFFLTYSICAYAEDTAGFDEICKIYTEAKNSSMPKRQLSDYIFDNIEQRVTSVDALEAHGAVFNLEPARRYSIFKQSAELSLKRDWNCEAVKELMK